MSEIVKPGGITLNGFLAAEITVVAITSSFVALRLIANLRLQNRLMVDDYLSVLAVFFLSGICALYYPTIAWLNDPTVDPLALARVSTATYFISAYSNYTAKAPLLVLYAKLFGVHKWVRITVYTTLTLGFIAYTATSIVGTLDNPEGKTLDAAYWAGFLQRSYGIAVANAVFNLTIDLIAFTIPIPIIYKLNLPVAKKIGLAFMFVSGIVAIASGAVSLHYRRSSSATTSEDLTIVCIFTFLDGAIAIILGCLPAIRTLFVKQSGRSRIFGRLRSNTSHDKSTVSKQTTPSQTHLHSGITRTQDLRQTHSYIELGEPGYNANITAARDYSARV